MINSIVPSFIPDISGRNDADMSMDVMMHATSNPILVCPKFQSFTQARNLTKKSPGSMETEDAMLSAMPNANNMTDMISMTHLAR